MPDRTDESRTDPQGRRNKIVWLAVAWLIGYAVFFFSFTLPNSNPATKRTDVWLELPDILWSNMVTPANVTSPTSWANLIQRFDLIAVAAAIWLGSWAVGCLALRALRIPLAPRSTERCVCAWGVGLSAVSLLTLGCGLVGWLSPFVLGGVLAAAIASELALRRSDRPMDVGHSELTSSARQQGQDWRNALIGVLTRGEQIPYDLICKSLASVAIALFLLAMLLGSLLPPTDFDVKAYHLTGPKEYFLNGRITFLEHNVYTNFPFLTEMLCLLGMVLRQDWYRGALAGQAVLMGFAPLAGLALFCAGRRWFGNAVGWLAATIFLTTPWTYRLAIIAYVEGALSCYLFLALFAVLLAIELVSWRLFVVAGLLAGSAMACKYPGLVSVVIPLGAVVTICAYRRGAGRSNLKMGGDDSVSGASDMTPPILNLEHPTPSVLKALLAFGVGVTIAIGPWLLKNIVETGNPVYPLAYGLFGGRDWDAASHAKWRAGHSPSTYAVSDLAEKFIDVTAKADWLSPLLFAFAPLAWAYGTMISQIQIPNSKFQTHLIRWLSLYVAYLFAQWWLLTHRIDRFWVPLIPVVALLAAVGIKWCERKLWRWASGALLGLSVLFNLGFITTPLCGFSAYLSDLDKARDGAESTAEGIHFLNQLHDANKLPVNATVLCVGEAQVFDARPRVIYNTVFDQPIFRDWLAERPAGDVPDGEWPLRSIEDVKRKFESHGVTHVLVNWQELLRYRMTYGYSDFVTPSRFAWLRENGVLGDPTKFPQGMREYESMSERDRRELDNWAPELKRRHQGKLVYVAWQLFAVRK